MTENEKLHRYPVQTDFELFAAVKHLLFTKRGPKAKISEAVNEGLAMWLEKNNSQSQPTKQE